MWKRPPRHKWPKAWHNIEERVVLVAVRETVWKKVPPESGWEESTNLEMLVRASAARSIPVRVRERHQIGREEVRSGTCVEKIDGTR